MKILIGLLLLGVTACGSDDLTRAEAAQLIQEEMPGTSRAEAGRMMDSVCNEFAKGWGGAVITEKSGVPEDEEETLAYIILISARAECPENVVDANTWLEYNGWD